MPVSPYLKTLAKDLGMSPRQLEIPWKRAKEITIETFGKPEEAFGNTEYKYAMDTVRSMLGLSEDSPMLPTNFLKSEKSAEEYLETLTSGQFDIGHVFVSDRGEPVKRSIAQDETDAMDDVGTDYPNASGNSSVGSSDVDGMLGLEGHKDENMSEGMNYGDRKKSEDDPEDFEDFLGLDGRPKYVEARQRDDYFYDFTKEAFGLPEISNHVAVYGSRTNYPIGVVEFDGVYYAADPNQAGRISQTWEARSLKQLQRQLSQDVYGDYDVAFMEKVSTKYVEGMGTFTQIDDEGRVWQEFEQQGMEWQVRQIDSTHFAMKLKNGRGRETVYHIGQFKGDPMYDDLLNWLRGREMIGGKVFEKIGGEPFPANLHADEGEPLQDREPNDSGNYKVDTVVVWDDDRLDSQTIHPWNEEEGDYKDKKKKDAERKADADKKKADADKKTQDVLDKQKKDREDKEKEKGKKESILDEVERFLEEANVVTFDLEKGIMFPYRLEVKGYDAMQLQNMLDNEFRPGMDFLRHTQALENELGFESKAMRKQAVEILNRIL